METANRPRVVVGVDRHAQPAGAVWHTRRADGANVVAVVLKNGRRMNR